MSETTYNKQTASGLSRTSDGSSSILGDRARDGPANPSTNSVAQSAGIKSKPSIRPVTAPVMVGSGTGLSSGLARPSGRGSAEFDKSAVEMAEAAGSKTAVPASSPCPLCARWVLYSFSCATPKNIGTSLLGFKVGDQTIR
jgi:hypothetical protein